MQSFHDYEGREWILNFNIRTTRAIRQRMRNVETLKDVDFLDYAALLFSLNDVYFAADLLYVACQEQADAAGVDAEDFGAALRGRILFDAIAALTAEYLDFFPDPTAAEKMRAVVGRNREVQTALADAICQKTEEETTKIFHAIGATISGEQSSDSSPLPESDSTASPN